MLACVSISDIPLAWTSGNSLIILKEFISSSFISPFDVPYTRALELRFITLISSSIGYCAPAIQNQQLPTSLSDTPQSQNNATYLPQHSSTVKVHCKHRTLTMATSNQHLRSAPICISHRRKILEIIISSHPLELALFMSTTYRPSPNYNPLNRGGSPTVCSTAPAPS